MRRSGFTLLEVLVALSLLAIAGTVVFRLFSAGTRGIGFSEDYVNAEVRAEARMREVLDRIGTGGGWSEQTRDGYRMDIEVSDVLSDRTADLPVRLVEVRVTISWKGRTGEKKLTLTTMRTVRREVSIRAPGHV